MISSRQKELLVLYNKLKPVIEGRLLEFKRASRNDNLVFEELCFCLFTPQSKAESCYRAVCSLKDKKLLFSDRRNEIVKTIASCGVRFKKNKTRYLVKARDNFKEIKEKIRYYETKKDIYGLRKWLVDNILGFGYKEAGHFLRNIGLGENIAILDRHILTNLLALGVISEIPETLNEKKYLEIEKKLVAFSRKANIPVAHVDLLFWAKQTGKVFK